MQIMFSLFDIRNYDPNLFGPSFFGLKKFMFLFRRSRHSYSRISTFWLFYITKVPKIHVFVQKVAPFLFPDIDLLAFILTIYMRFFTNE